MSKLKCDRCDGSLGGYESDLPNSYFTSFYNAQVICAECRKEETFRHDYRECRSAEAEAVQAGDLNFCFLPPWKKKKG